MCVRLARDPPRAAVPLSGRPLVLAGRELGFLASQLGSAVLPVVGTLRPQLGFRLQPVFHLVSRFRAPREIQFVGSSGDGVRVKHKARMTGYNVIVDDCEATARITDSLITS